MSSNRCILAIAPKAVPFAQRLVRAASPTGEEKAIALNFLSGAIANRLQLVVSVDVLL